jgi:spore coat-associated protein N
MSRLLTIAAVGLAVATGLGTAPAERPVETHVELVGGTLSMSNSKDGGAIVTAGGMAPGDTLAGDVRISNTGDLAGAYSLSQSNLADSPGPAGGALSSALDVLVQDVTNLAAPATVYSGKLATMGPRDLGTWGPGAARTYRFTVSLPDGGPPPSPVTGDNAYQGSAVSVKYDWTATGEEPGGGGGGNGGGGGGGGGNGGGSGSPQTAPDLTVTGKKRQRLVRQKGLVVFARCSAACSISAKAKGKKAAKKVKLSTWKGQAQEGERVKIRLRLSKKRVKAAKKALRRGRKPTMTVTVRATAGAGLSTVRRLKVSVR